MKSSWNLEKTSIRSDLQPMRVPTRDAVRVNRQ